MKYKVGSLFAGVGGIDLGLMLAKYQNKEFEIIWANEIDKYACATYKYNFDHKLFEMDINDIISSDDEVATRVREYIRDTDIDVLVAGFPCQAFSIAGERKGFEDHRGNLFWSIIDIIEILKQKPRVLLLENVKNLKGHDNGRTYKIITKALSKYYIIKDKVINTYDITDIPQNRERIYMVCFLNEEDAGKFKILEDDNYQKLKTPKDNKHRVENINRVIDFNINQDTHPELYYSPIKHPHYFNKTSNEGINLHESIIEEYEFYQLRRGIYVRQNKQHICPTLTANMGTGGHNVPLIKVKDGIRKLSPKETFNLQGFRIDDLYKLPKFYNGKKFSSGRLYKQAGNAVTVNVIKILGENILKSLDK